MFVNKIVILKADSCHLLPHYLIIYKYCFIWGKSSYHSFCWNWNWWIAVMFRNCLLYSWCGLVWCSTGGGAHDCHLGQIWCDLLWNKTYLSCDSFFTWIDERVTPVSCWAQIAGVCIYDWLLSCFTAHRPTLLLLLHHDNLCSPVLMCS
jgi:hypothetical protein